MTYATLAQLTAKLGALVMIQLTDRGQPPTGAVVESVVDRALADTDAVIDSYLASRYALPIVGGVPAVVVDLALAIAAYKLHPFTPDKKIEDDYKDALSSLKLIATGTQRLQIAGVEPSSSGSGGVMASDRPRDLTPENMRGLI